MWGLLLSVLTIAVSLVTEKEGREKGGSTSRGGGGGYSLSLLAGCNNHVFLSGAVLGTGISLLVSSLSQQFRLAERCKALWHYIWDWEKKSDAPFRIPTSVLATKDAAVLAKQYILKSDDGTINCLVSPLNAATFKLNVCLITILPGREMPTQTAKALEVYYVVSGEGLFSQQGIDTTSHIEKGDCFVVDPGSIRWISNSHNGSISSENLVLLRSTDGGYAYSNPKSNIDTIRKDPNRRYSTIDILNRSLKQAHDMVTKVYVGHHHQHEQKEA